MTLAEFARSVVEDPSYRDSIIARARAGTLPEVVEMLLLESYELAGGRLALGSTPQSRTLALIRPPASSPAQEQV